MITDNKTNFLYLSALLPVRYPDFWEEFSDILEANSIAFDFLPDTKDIWARDFMPVQTAKNRFVQFSFNPGYLDNEKFRHLKSDPAKITLSIGLKPIKSDIILDGGNVVKSKTKAILTDKIFSENPHYSKAALLNELKIRLEVEHIFIIPKQPYDFTGHADGMVRFLNEDTLLVNDYAKESTSFQKKLSTAISKTGLNLITFPYKFDRSLPSNTAYGVYINFLRIGNVIVLPIFGINEDYAVIKFTKSLFPECKVEEILSSELAEEGGLLNCISWNILK